MCVIFTVDEKQNLTEEEVFAASCANSDGWGVAWPETQEDGRTLVRWKKGLTEAEFLAEIAGLELVPYVAHARLATAGGVKPELTHPFPVTRNAGTMVEGIANEVLFHNGHWGDWSDYFDALLLEAELSQRELPGGVWSDSRLLAYLAGRYGTAPVLNIFEESGKVALLRGDGITTIGSFAKVRTGIMASNLYWEWQGRSVSYGTSYRNGYSHGGGWKYENGGGWWEDETPPAPKFSIGEIVLVNDKATASLAHLIGYCGLVKAVGGYSTEVEILEHPGTPTIWMGNQILDRIEGLSDARFIEIDLDEDEEAEPLVPGTGMLCAINGDEVTKTVVKNIVVGDYVQYKRFTDDEMRTEYDAWGRVVMVEDVGTEDEPLLRFDVYNAGVEEIHTRYLPEIVEAFSATRDGSKAPEGIAPPFTHSELQAAAVERNAYHDGIVAKEKREKALESGLPVCRRCNEKLIAGDYWVTGDGSFCNDCHDIRMGTNESATG